MPDTTVAVTPIDMIEPMACREAIRQESEVDHFFVSQQFEPEWQIPRNIAIQVAVSGRSGLSPEGTESPTDIEDYIAAASQVIEAGACGIHVDFSFVTDSAGRRLDRDLPSVEAYRAVLDPLRARFGDSFIANLNVLNGPTFEDCVAPATQGLAEVAPAAAGLPDAYLIPAIRRLEECGVKPEIVVHSSGEVGLAKRKLVDTGLVSFPTNWIILYGLPYEKGRTLVSGTWVDGPRAMSTHLFLMVDQIRQLDPNASITVCGAGRAGLYMTTLASMLGLNLRVGIEDMGWLYPNRDEYVHTNLQIFERARVMAEMLGRVPMTADEYRKELGITDARVLHGSLA